MTNTNLAPLQFHDTALRPIVIDGKEWFSASEIGQALGFANASKSVRQIYSENANEFTPAMAMIQKVENKGGPDSGLPLGGAQTTRVFSLRGMHMVGMKSRTPRAAEFRTWVLDVLEGKAAPATPATDALNATERKLLETAVQLNAALTKVAELQDAQIERLNEILNPPERKSTKKLADEERQMILALAAQGMKKDEIVKRVGRSLSTVNNYVRSITTTTREVTVNVEVQA